MHHSSTGPVDGATWPPSLTAGPVDERDAFWCWAHTTAVLFDDHGPSVTAYLRTQIHEWHEQMDDYAAQGDMRRSCESMCKRDAYRDALRVLELATEAADRMTARYDDERRAVEVLRHPWGPC